MVVGKEKLLHEHFIQSICKPKRSSIS